MDDDGEFRDRIPVVESKTSKINRCFISDAIKETLTEYRKWLGGRNCSPDDYIFSKNNGGRLQEQSYVTTAGQAITPYETFRDY